MRVAAAGAIALALALPLPSAASAAVPASIPASRSVTATSATPAQGTWALDFTLPTFGKSGCLVCHNDPKLVVPKGVTDVSFWIDEASYDRSSHAKVVCTGCHLDFGYKAPHDGADWKSVAKQSCVNCHDAAFRDFTAGAHAGRPSADKRPDPKAADKPLCGDCHGAHDIAVLKKNPSGQAALHASAQFVCGREGCHKDYWDSYSDYYHGAAYKRGAADAPACWDCHGAHTVIVTTSTISPTNAANIVETCSKGATGKLRCHIGASEGLMQYVRLIHRKGEVVAGNPLYAFFATVRSWFE